MPKFRLIPTKRQWRDWSLPSKLTAIGAYVGIISTLWFAVDKTFNLIPANPIVISPEGLGVSPFGEGEIKNRFEVFNRGDAPVFDLWLKISVEDPAVQKFNYRITSDDGRKFVLAMPYLQSNPQNIKPIPRSNRVAIVLSSLWMGKADAMLIPAVDRRGRIALYVKLQRLSPNETKAFNLIITPDKPMTIRLKEIAHSDTPDYKWDFKDGSFLFLTWPETSSPDMSKAQFLELASQERALENLR